MSAHYGPYDATKQSAFGASIDTAVDTAICISIDTAQHGPHLSTVKLAVDATNIPSRGGSNF